MRGGCRACHPLRRGGRGRTRAPIPMILAAGAVHTPSRAPAACAPSRSLNVRSAECLDVHYFAVLIGVGATAVNAYLAEAAIADRHAPRPVPRG